MTREPALPLPASPTQPKLLTLRLSIMMFLQWAMFGLWIPLASVFLLAGTDKGGLGFSQGQLVRIMGISGSIGALAAPFIAGQIADRYFSTQRLMAVILVIGGVLWWIMSEQKAYPAWLALAITGSLALGPTGALSNSLAFAHMRDPTRQFPIVRVWGTIGWIVAMWIFAWVWLRQTFVVSGDFPFILLHESVELTWKPMFLMGKEHADVTARMVQSLKAGAIVAFVYAAYCLTLPNTPPTREAAEKLAFWKAFRLFRHSSFLVLMVAALLIACVHNIFFLQTGKLLGFLGLAQADIGPAMTIGQITEIVMIVVLGWLLKRLGMRAVLTIGGVAYLLRFLFLGSTWLPLWAIVVSLGFHGICFACYYAAAFIYVERLAEHDIRHTAQTLFGILIGVGPIISIGLNDVLANRYPAPNVAIVEKSTTVAHGKLVSSAGENFIHGHGISIEIAGYDGPALDGASCKLHLTPLPEDAAPATTQAIQTTRPAPPGPALVLDATIHVEDASVKLRAGLTKEQLDLLAPALREVEPTYRCEFLAALPDGSTQVVAAARASVKRGLDYSPYWYVVAAVGALAAIVLALLFRDQSKEGQLERRQPA